MVYHLTSNDIQKRDYGLLNSAPSRKWYVFRFYTCLLFHIAGNI